MGKGLPSKANVGVPGKPVNIDPAVYFTAKRMEARGLLQPGQALVLAAVLPDKAVRKTTKRGKK